MKRDLDLCKKILFKIEELYVDEDLCDIEIDGYNAEQIVYHFKLLKDGNFIKNYHVIPGDDGIYSFYVGNLTWEGHDFVEKVRNDNVWKKMINVMKDKFLPFTAQVLAPIITQIIQDNNSK